MVTVSGAAGAGRGFSGASVHLEILLGLRLGGLLGSTTRRRRSSSRWERVRSFDEWGWRPGDAKMRNWTIFYAFRKQVFLYGELTYLS
jgi:hypothetical protein